MTFIDEYDRKEREFDEQKIRSAIARAAGTISKKVKLVGGTSYDLEHPEVHRNMTWTIGTFIKGEPRAFQVWCFLGKLNALPL